MTEGIARDTIGNLSDELTEGLEVAAQVGPALARGLRGNPRQLKRFLNRLLVRLRTAERRHMGLDADKLAKLMVLEELHPKHFNTLFTWQIDTETGAPPAVGFAERLARGERVADAPPEATDWSVQPGLRDWLQLSPCSPTSTSLRTSPSRDRLTTTVSAARLSAELLTLLGELQSSVAPKRAKAVQNAAACRSRSSGSPARRREGGGRGRAPLLPGARRLGS